MTANAAGELEREFRELEAAGVDGVWLEGSRLAKRVKAGDARAAIRTVGAGVVDPYLATLGIIRAAERAKARIFERSTVTAVQPGRHDVADAGASVGDLGMDDNSDRYGTGEHLTADKEPRTRPNADRDTDRVVGAGEAGLGRGLDQAEEAQLGIADDEAEEAAGDRDQP